ncbi:hypothetical protein F5Y15DRAFT_378773 [Xylariaceae sp. FL0016]|nr:hypothetical protein F5Y15DRAFT_378773 [Xylariaceae sp. FL0016]
MAGKLTLEDWLDDLCVRFIINLPREDLSSIERICFQIEEAQWYYEDFIRPLDPALPSMSLKTFSMKMFQHCPLLSNFSAESRMKAFDQFMEYKQRIPVRGGILLNGAMDAAVLVRGWKKGSSWSFPRGKINKEEDDLVCAIREIYEETGYDLRAAGLVEKNYPVQHLEVTMHDQQVRLYVFRGVPQDTVFETKTRKEIGAIAWYNVSDLPAFRNKKKAAARHQTSGDKFYMVAPFMVQLRQWVVKQKNIDAQNAAAFNGHNHPQMLYNETVTDDNMLPERKEPQVTNIQAEEEFVDSTSRQLKQLLQHKPPTQGLQTANQEAGQALMSLLQPKATSHIMSSGQLQPHTPFEQQLPEVPQPTSPHHHHHPTQRMPLSAYGAPPDFPIHSAAHPGYGQPTQHQGQYVNVRQQQRPRPQVYVENVHPVSHAPQQLQNRPFQTDPIQLIHPQPLPPQVQKDLLLREMVSSSPTGVGSAVRTGPNGSAHGNVHMAQAALSHFPNHGAPTAQHGDKLPTQLPAHSASLLNVLKGNSAQAAPHQPARQQQGSLQGTAVAFRDSSTRDHRKQQSVPVSKFADEYGPPARSPAMHTAVTMSTQAAMSASSVRPVIPKDEHHLGLLNMFRKVESPASQGQVDGQSANPTGRRPQQEESAKQQWPSKGSTAAEALRASAQENGCPIQMHPETNLPFGAHSILARPRQTRQGQLSEPSSATPMKQSGENQLNLSVRSHPSPASGSQMSPLQNQLHQADPNPKAHHGAQLSPQAGPPSAQSYPYGDSPGLGPNPLALFPNPPSASSLPVPGGTKVRRESTAEQKNALLSLFGKPKTDQEQYKGLAGEHVTGGIAPRSRLASIASSEGEGAIRGNGGLRRGSSTPMSPGDRSFLLNFLGKAS